MVTWKESSPGASSLSLAYKKCSVMSEFFIAATRRNLPRSREPLGVDGVQKASINQSDREGANAMYGVRPNTTTTTSNTKRKKVPLFLLTPTVVGMNPPNPRGTKKKGRHNKNYYGNKPGHAASLHFRSSWQSQNMPCNLPGPNL
jgi:hypothetical protein